MLLNKRCGRDVPAMPDRQDAYAELDGKSRAIAELARQFGRCDIDMDAYLDAVSDCSAMQVAAACKRLIDTDTDFMPRPGKVRQMVDTVELTHVLILGAKKRRAMDALHDEVAAAMRQAARAKDIALAAARAKRLPYHDYAQLRDATIYAYRDEITRLEQVRAAKNNEIYALAPANAIEEKNNG